MTRSVGGAIASYFRSFSPSMRPLLSRRNYAWELRAAALMPAAVACVEGNVVGVIANKAFLTGADPRVAANVVAALAAAGPVALLSSALWTRLLHARDRVRVVNLLQLGAIACVAAIAVAPYNAVGVAMLVAATYAARFFLTGVITARSDIWRANYPRNDRARATGAVTIVTTLVVAVTALLVARSMDVEALRGNGFRLVYAVAIALALVGVWAFSHVHWRGRAQHLRGERGSDALAPDLPGPRAMLRVLRTDRLYRRFMIAQFVLGAPNLAAVPVFIIALEDTFAPDYTRSILLTQIIPIAMPIIVIPLWARFLDRVHVIRFRAYHSWTFVLANLLLTLGLVTHSEPIVWLARLTLGIAFGGGMLAWSLGHHDFATRELASIYMGIHATLTGVRGFIAPFAGVLLYSGTWFVPALGAWTFLVLAAVGASAAIMFARLHAHHVESHPESGSDEG